eukprot:scaffold46973_cov57-Phaeocystis_antarctica.AAC.2
MATTRARRRWACAWSCRMLVETFGGLGPALVEEADSWRQTLYLGGQRVLHRLRLLVVVRVFDDAAELMSSLSTRLYLGGSKHETTTHPGTGAHQPHTCTSRQARQRGGGGGTAAAAFGGRGRADGG